MIRFNDRTEHLTPADQASLLGNRLDCLTKRSLLSYGLLVVPYNVNTFRIAIKLFGGIVIRGLLVMLIACATASGTAALKESGKALWSAFSEPADFVQAADGDNALAVLHRGVLCIRDGSSGKIRWCTKGGIETFAISGGTVISTDRFGRSTGRNLTTGRVGFTTSRASSTSDPQEAEDSAYAVPRGFLLQSRRRVRAQLGEIREVDLSGRPLWTSALGLRSHSPRSFQSYIAFSEVDPGATLFGVVTVFKLGEGGGFVRSVVHGLSPLDVQRDALYVLDDRTNEDAEFASLTFRVRKIDVRSGRELRNDVYSPDFEPNREALRSGEGNPYAFDPRARIGGRFLYALTSSVTYRYHLDAPQEQPLRIDGAYVAGPFGFSIIVQSSSAIMRFDGDDGAKAKWSTPTSSRARACRGDARDLYCVFADGHVEALQLSNGARILEASACRATDVLLAKAIAFVRCSDSSSIIAYRR